MEITSVYHRPESEFAYLYDEKTMHIRLRTQKGDMRGAHLHYGDTGIFYLKGYEHCVPMQKILIDKYYDYFESKVKVSHHRIQYIFELEDQAGLKLLYGDRGVAPNQKEQLNHFMNGFKLPYCHEVDHCKEPTWLNGDEYHAVMNYNLAEPIKQYFLTGEIDTAELIHQVIVQQMKYRRQVTEAMLNLLDSHDTPRILTLAKGNKDFVKAALTFLFLQADSPCLYYETEVGLEGEEDPDNRRAMAWKLDQVDSEMKDFVSN